MRKNLKTSYSWALTFSGGIMGVVIRQGTPADVDAIAAVTRLAYMKWLPLIGREPLPMKADYAAAIVKHRFDLLFVDDDLAALIETVLRDDDMLIENVAVRPAFQKRGFGSRLIELAEEVAAMAGRTTVRLYTNARFEENLRLYGSLGYAVERKEPFNGSLLVHMVKRFV